MEVFKNPIRRRYICAKGFIDEYIRYGGTMSFGGVHYNETSPFASKESADAYVDTAIARNIQYSLRCYQYERYFHHLRDLTRESDVLHLPDVGTKSDRTVITQPSLRYAQAEALIRSLLLDETFSALSLAERTAI